MTETQTVQTHLLNVYHHVQRIRDLYAHSQRLALEADALCAATNTQSVSQSVDEEHVQGL